MTTNGENGQLDQQTTERAIRVVKPFMVAPCEHPGCGEQYVKATHYSRTHGVKLSEHLEPRLKKLGYTLCIHCKAHIDGDTHPEGARHLFTDHLNLFPELQEQVAQEPSFGLPKPPPEYLSDIAELVGSADRAIASARDLLDFAVQTLQERIADLESRLTLEETENRAKNDRISYLENEVRDLLQRFNRSQAVIVQMRAQAHNREEFDRIYEEYRRAGGR